MDDFDINEKIRTLRSKQVKLQEQKKIISDYQRDVQSKVDLSQKELQQKEFHYKTLHEYVIMESKLDKVQLEDSDQDTDQVLVEKKALEKLNFQMDKYFIYINQFIEMEDLDKPINQDSQQYNASQVLAILVKLQKSSFPSNLKIPDTMTGDDDQYVVNTFRFAKTSTLESLKETCLRYWEFISNKMTNMFEDQQRDQEVGNQILERFEFLSEDGQPIQCVQIDQYLTQYCQNQTSLSIILRKKKNKPSHRVKVGDESHQIFSEKHSEKHSDKHSVVEQSMAKSDGKSTEFKSQTNKASTQLKSITSRHSISSQQVQQDDDENEDEENDPEFQVKLKNRLFMKFYTFFKRFDLIKKMFIIDPVDVEERGKNVDKPKPKRGLECDDNNICVILMLFLLLLMNGIFISIIEDGPFVYSHKQKLGSYLNIGAPGIQGSYLDISSIKDLTAYLTDIRGLPFNLMANNSEFNANYDIIGGIRFRQVRTKFRNCSFVQRRDQKSQVYCMYNYYDDKTKVTDLISDGKNQWQVYVSSQVANTSRIIQGTFSSYDQSGYIQDLPLNQITVGSYDKIIVENMLENESYFPDNMLAFFITFTVRCKNDGAFFFIELFIEYPTSGLFPNQPIILSFSPNIFGSGDNNPYSITAQTKMSTPDGPNEYQSGLRLYWIVIGKILVGTIHTLVVLNQLLLKLKESLAQIFKHLVSITFIVNLMLIYTNFSSVNEALNLSSMGYDVEWLLNYEQYIDLGLTAFQYRQVVQSTASCISILIIRAFLQLNVLKSVEYIFSSIEQQYLSIMACFALFLSILSGFTFISLQVWGYYTVDFSTFGRALLSLILITMSQFDADHLYNYQPTFSLVFMLFFFFLVLYFLSNILAVIYIDSYRLMILNNGEIQSDGWTKTDWLMWLFSWAPESFKQKCILKAGELIEEDK
ncbi:hypothetical protein pb186bvf_002699 [Paramecium bursaria]